MADVKQIVRQIANLAEELGREVDGALAASCADVRARLAEAEAQLEQARMERDEALAARQEAEREVDVAEKRVDSLVQKLKEARQAAVEASEEAQRTLRRQMEALQSECDDARNELERERSVRKRLEKGASADEKRLHELEKALGAGKAAAVSGGADVAALQEALREAREAVGREGQARERLERELAETGRQLAVAEQALSQVKSTARSAADDDDTRGQLAALAEKLRTVESELAAEQQLSRRYARECAEAQRQLTEQEARGAAPAPAAPVPVADRPMLASKPATDKALPHELRPGPKPGALFHPDWNLNALPCSSAEQILQVWASVSNVQLSLEGYPSQYCSAYLVVLKQGKQKQLYMLFNLKEIKHILVCVPSTPPKDEASLNKLVGEGQKYLLMSGFDLEKLSSADIPTRLDHYLQR